MKNFIYFHICLLFTIGTIFCIVGLLIMLGVSQLISALLPNAQMNSLLLLGTKSLVSIISGGAVFLQGILLNCFALTMWMLLKIAFRPARILKPVNPEMQNYSNNG